MAGEVSVWANTPSALTENGIDVSVLRLNLTAMPIWQRWALLPRRHRRKMLAAIADLSGCDVASANMR